MKTIIRRNRSTEFETEDLEEVEVDKIDGDESKNADEIDETSLIIKPEGKLKRRKIC